MLWCLGIQGTDPHKGNTTYTTLPAKTFPPIMTNLKCVILLSIWQLNGKWKHVLE
jgi:hypothetical protein